MDFLPALKYFSYSIWDAGHVTEDQIGTPDEGSDMSELG